MARVKPADLQQGDVVEYKTVGSIQTARVERIRMEGARPGRLEGRHVVVVAVNVQDYPGPVNLRFNTATVKVVSR